MPFIYQPRYRLRWQQVKLDVGVPLLPRCRSSPQSYFFAPTPRLAADDLGELTEDEVIHILRYNFVQNELVHLVVDLEPIFFATLHDISMFLSAVFQYCIEMPGQIGLRYQFFQRFFSFGELAVTDGDMIGGAAAGGLVSGFEMIGLGGLQHVEYLVGRDEVVLEKANGMGSAICGECVGMSMGRAVALVVHVCNFCNLNTSILLSYSITQILLYFPQYVTNTLNILVLVRQVVMLRLGQTHLIIIIWQNMLNYKQLYQANNFDLPQITPPQLKPFHDHHTQIHADPTRDASIAKLFKGSEYHFMSFKSSYSSELERLCAKENLYPFMMGVGRTKIVIVCKDMLMVTDWKLNDLGRVFQGGDDLVTFQKWEKAKLPQIPTSIKVGQFGVYLGFQTGRIAQYLFKTKAWQGSNEELQFPVMKIQVLKQQQGKQASVLGLDSAGNIVLISFSHKTFMDKIIKTMSTARWVSFIYRNKKREKIKKLFKNLMKNETDTQTGSTQTVETSTPYSYNKMDLKYIKDDIVLAVFRKNILELLVLNKDFQLVKTIVVDDSHKDEKELEVAFVEIGEGGFQNANTTHNILVLGLGYSLHFYRIIQIEQGYEVVKVSQVQVESPLIYGSFISNNLLAVGDRHQLYLTNINSKPQSLVALQTLKFSYVDFFVEEQNLDIDKQLLLSNLFCLLMDKNQEDKMFMGLQGKRLIIGKIFGWRTILLKLLFESRYQFAIRCFQSIYSLQFKLCCAVSQNTSARNQQMRDLCQKIIKGYLETNLSALRANPYSQQSACVVNNLIYFLLKCEQPQILFQSAETFFRDNQLQELFLEELDRYVQRTNGYELKLTFISEKYLKLIINRYKIKGKQYALQKLFMGFDLNQMQRLVLLTTCLQEGLYRSLINICCEQKDYITPIIKLCGIGINNPTQQRRIGEIIFWYLGECLAGRMTEFGNQQEYLNMLTVLINFMFIPSSIEMLLMVNHTYMITTISLFFQSRVMRLILENEDRFFMRKDCEEGSLFEQNCMSEFRLYQRMLLSLMGAIQKSKQQLRNAYEEELNRFLIPLMLRNHFPFLAKFKINIIRYFIAHPLLYIGGQQLTQQKQLEVNGQLMRLLESLIRSICQKCLNLRQKIKQDIQTVNELQILLKNQKENELNSILELMMLSPFSEQFSQTKCYIYHQLGHYATVLQGYLKMLNKKIRMKVFSYLENNLNDCPELTNEFIKYLLSLVRIDQTKTIKLLWQTRSGWVDHEQIIDKLVDYAAIQLNYIQKVLNNGGERSKKLLLRHLQIVLRQKSENVQTFISKIDYPLEQAYKMCEEHNNRMGKACILIKSGRNMEGVIIISEIFLESVRQYFSILRKGLQIEEQRKAKIMSQFRVVLQTCQKEWLIDNERGQDIWEKNTELIFRKMGVYNIDSPHIPESIRQFLNEIISELLATMFEQVSTEFFFNRFVKTFSSLPLRIFFQAYKYIQSRLQFSFTIQKLNTDLLQQQELRTWKQIMSSIYHAHICELVCVSCSYSITNNEKMVSYSCHHVFHEQCYYQQNSKKSKNQLCPLCFNVIQNYLICGESKPYRYRLQVDQKQLLKVKMGKMNYYDRISHLNGLQSGSKYLDQVDF